MTLLDEDGRPTRERESLWGLEDDQDDYLAQCAEELADTIMARVEVERPDVQLSEN